MPNVIHYRRGSDHHETWCHQRLDLPYYTTDNDRAVQCDDCRRHMGLAKPKIVHLWTDGSCLRNPGGAGGWGYVLTWTSRVIRTHRRENSGFLPTTTSNRAELQAVLNGLEAIKPKGLILVVIHTDSEYVQTVLTNYDSAEANTDLIRQIRFQASKFTVRLDVVRGHSGVADNERCHSLANSAAMQG